MPSFESLFRESKGQPIQYNGVELKRIDRFPVKNNDILFCVIEETVKKDCCLQGFCIDITGYAEVNGKTFKQGKGVRLHFWDGFCDEGVKIKVFTKLDYVIVYNICEIDSSFITVDEYGNAITKYSKTIDYWHNGAAMIVEQISGGRLYRCSDVSPAEKPFPFNDIVFTVKKLVS